MRAVVVHEFGPISSHKVEEWPDPEIAPGEVLIENHAVGLNFPDALMLQGKYQKRPERPFVPGRDLAGVVRAVGSGVTRCKPGDRVVAQVFKGAFGELVPAPEARCFVMPDDMPFEDAAGMITVFNTAWVAVEQRGRVQATDTVMITGAAGGVGLAAVQLCKARGATVLAAVSKPEKGALAQENGADHVIDTNADDADALKRHLQAQVAAATGAPEGRGCNVVIDTVGSDLFEAGLRVLAFGGNLVVVGFSGGSIPAAKANYLLYNNIGVMGAPLDIQFEHNYAEMERGVGEMFRLWGEGKVRANISARYPLADFSEAFDTITGRKAMGKVVLTL
jgi:NADPH2:quinone reductase